MKSTLTALILLASVSTTNAGVIMNVFESGSDVVVTASGTIDLTALTPGTSPSNSPFMSPGNGQLVSGTNGAASDLYQFTAALPSSFGTPGFFGPTSNSGAPIGISNPGGTTRVLHLPGGYSSEAFFSGGSVYAGQSFASMGLTPGDYTWTWGTGTTEDTFTISIGDAPAAVPEPSTWALLTLAGVCFGGYQLRRRNTK